MATRVISQTIDLTNKFIDKYITLIDDGGIRIHPVNTQQSSIVINAEGMTIFTGGTNENNSIAQYGTTIRIGASSAPNVTISPTDIVIKKDTNNHIDLTSSGLEIYQGGNFVADIGSTIRLGLLVNSHATITPSAFMLEKSSTAYFSVSASKIYYRGTSAAKTGIDIDYNNNKTSISIGGMGNSSTIKTSEASNGGIAIGDYELTTDGYVYTTATGEYSSARGKMAIAEGNYSTSYGQGTSAKSNNQTAIGKYNTEDSSSTYAFIVGNGTGYGARSNALTVDWNGNITIDKNGGIYYKGTKSTYRMIRFIDNTADTYGNGISIGGGGLAVLGSGESADTLLTNLSLTASGGTETTYITSDGSILFYPTINSWDAAGAITMTAGRLWVGVNDNTTRENQLGVQSGAGRIYMWSGAATNANRGIYIEAHGTGAAKAAMIVDTNNNVTFNGTLSGNATSATSATYLKDRTNSTTTYTNYGASGLAGSAISWLACWNKDTNNNYELRAISKAEVFNVVRDNGGDSRWVNVTGDTMTGLLKITTNSNTVTIGSQNASWCHFSNSADIPFYFNKSIGISGTIGTSSYPATSVYVSGSVLGKSSRNLINNATSNQCHVGNSSDNLYLYGLTSGTSGSTLKTSSNRIYYDSSSRKYKHDIENLSDKSLDPKKLYDLNVRQFIFNDDFLTEEDDRYHKLVVGLIAEEVYEKYPIAANFLNGKPEDWNERYIIPPMLKLIQDQHKEIEQLKKEVQELKNK